MPRWLAILTAATYLSVLGGVLASQLNSADAKADPPSPAPAAAPDRTLSETRYIGFALGVHHMASVDPHLEALDEIKKLGCDTVLLITPAYQKHGASTDIGIDPQRCPTREQLEKIITGARQRGLRVMLMPIVLFSEPRGNEWRGKIRPDDWDAWWADYTAMMTDFAALAEAHGVEAMTVGSELLSTERQAERWTAHIAAMRDEFSGRLTYSTNWDHYTVPVFWDQLDAIGINGYWRIADDADAADADLADRWREIREQVLRFSEKKERPVILTEIGYPSLKWALRDPWNYIGGEEKSAPDVQRRGYAAFFQAWSETLSEPGDAFDGAGCGGVFFYEWDIFHEGGPDDTGFGVRGKPALALLEKMIPRLRAGIDEGVP